MINSVTYVAPYVAKADTCRAKNNDSNEEVITDSVIGDLDNLDSSDLTIAHRGYSQIAPENTLAAFNAAIDNGFGTIEIDINWTKDGIPVVIHDNKINRTARKEDGSRLIIPRYCSNLTYDELLQYDFGGWFDEEFKGEKIPSFEQTLALAKENDINLYVELKKDNDFDDEKAKKLVDLVNEYNLQDNVTWISFNEDYLKLISENDTDARLGYLSKSKITNNTIETLNELNNSENEVFLDVKSSKINSNSADLLNEAGYDFEAWTVDSVEEYEKLLELNCKGVTTNSLEHSLFSEE